MLTGLYVNVEESGRFTITMPSFGNFTLYEGTWSDTENGGSYAIEVVPTDDPETVRNGSFNIEDGKLILSFDEMAQGGKSVFVPATGEEPVMNPFVAMVNDLNNSMTAAAGEEVPANGVAHTVDSDLAQETMQSGRVVEISVNADRLGFTVNPGDTLIVQDSFKNEVKYNFVVSNVVAPKTVEANENPVTEIYGYSVG